MSYFGLISVLGLRPATLLEQTSYCPRYLCGLSGSSVFSHRLLYVQSLLFGVSYKCSWFRTKSVRESMQSTRESCCAQLSPLSPCSLSPCSPIFSAQDDAFVLY